MTSLENCTGTTKETVQKRNRTILTFDPAKENIFVVVLRLRVILRQKFPSIEEIEFYYEEGENACYVGKEGSQWKAQQNTSCH